MIYLNSITKTLKTSSHGADWKNCYDSVIEHGCLSTRKRLSRNHSLSHFRTRMKDRQTRTHGEKIVGWKGRGMCTAYVNGRMYTSEAPVRDGNHEEWITPVRCRRRRHVLRHSNLSEEFDVLERQGNTRHGCHEREERSRRRT